jgi:hypothetical protein
VRGADQFFGVGTFGVFKAGEEGVGGIRERAAGSADAALAVFQGAVPDCCSGALHVALPWIAGCRAAEFLRPRSGVRPGCQELFYACGALKSSVHASRHRSILNERLPASSRKGRDEAAATKARLARGDAVTATGQDVLIRSSSARDGFRFVR